MQSNKIPSGEVHSEAADLMVSNGKCTATGMTMVATEVSIFGAVVCTERNTDVTNAGD